MPVAALKEVFASKSGRPLKTALTLLYKALASVQVSLEEELQEKYRVEGENPNATYIAVLVARELIGVKEHFKCLGEQPPVGVPHLTYDVLLESLGMRDMYVLSSVFFTARDICKFMSEHAAAECNFEFFSKNTAGDRFIVRNDPVREVAVLALRSLDAPEDLTSLITPVESGDFKDEMQAVIDRCADVLLSLDKNAHHGFFVGLDALKVLVNGALDLPGPELFFICARGRTEKQVDRIDAGFRFLHLKAAAEILARALPEKKGEATDKREDHRLPTGFLN